MSPFLPNASSVWLPPTFGTLRLQSLPWWRSVMQQAKPSWLPEWLGQKRRPSWGMLTHKPLHQRETAQQENTCNLMSVASAVKIVKLNNALEDERSWFYSNSLVCTLCHQNWLQKTKERVISELPGVFYLHFIKLVFWLNVLHCDEFHRGRN